jgi:hypothetical protein
MKNRIRISYAGKMVVKEDLKDTGSVSAGHGLK